MIAYTVPWFLVAVVPIVVAYYFAQVKKKAGVGGEEEDLR